MKNFKLFAIALLGAFFLNSCETIEDVSLETKDAPYSIESIENADIEESRLATEFLAASSLSGRSEGFETIEVVKYVGLPGKSIVATYKNKNAKTTIQRSLILISDDNNVIAGAMEHEKISDGNGIATVNVYDGENLKFTAKVDEKNDKVIEIDFFSSTNGRSAEMPYWECVEMAVGACVSDGECAFICGIVWQYCLGSIGVACLFVD